MKKALALSAFALVLALPLAISAATVATTFKTSTNGTSEIWVGDTITFDIYVTLSAGVNYARGGFSLSGDIANAATTSRSAGWPGVAHTVTAWT